MAEFTEYPAGTPSWVDLASPDLEASVGFYTSLFDWESENLGPEAGNYTFFKLRGHLIAGAGPLQMEGQPSAWTTYIAVDDADDIATRVGDAGGMTFMPPMDVMTAGRMAIFADSTGAAFGIWQAQEHKGAGLANEPGAFTWNELNTRDISAALTFYRSVFGWEGETQTSEGGMSYTEWKSNGSTIGGMMDMSAMAPDDVPANWLTYFAVADCDASVAKAAGLGASTIVPPTDIEPGRFSVLMDPAGAAFAIIATKG